MTVSGPTLASAPAAAGMLPVLKLFLIPIGGGIPAGVLLARANGLAWPVTAGLYLISDLILALALEPILLGLAALAERVPALARFRTAFRAASQRCAAPF